jgi:hypothetical protein
LQVGGDHSGAFQRRFGGLFFKQVPLFNNIFVVSEERNGSAHGRGCKITTPIHITKTTKQVGTSKNASTPPSDQATNQRAKQPRQQPSRANERTTKEAVDLFQKNNSELGTNREPPRGRENGRPPLDARCWAFAQRRRQSKGPRNAEPPPCEATTNIVLAPPTRAPPR